MSEISKGPIESIDEQGEQLQPVDFVGRFKEKWALEEASEEGKKNLPTLIFLLMSENGKSLEAWVENWVNIEREEKPHMEMSLALSQFLTERSLKQNSQFGLNGYLVNILDDGLTWRADIGGGILAEDSIRLAAVTDKEIFNFLNRYNIHALYRWHKDGSVDGNPDEDAVDKLTKKFNLSDSDSSVFMRQVNELRILGKPVDFEQIAKTLKETEGERRHFNWNNILKDYKPQ